MTKPLQHAPLRHSESTRHYTNTKHVNFADQPLMEAPPPPPLRPKQLYQGQDRCYEVYGEQTSTMMMSGSKGGEMGDIEGGRQQSDSGRGVLDDFGYSTIYSTAERNKIGGLQTEITSDMEYYTSSETGSQETVKFKPKPIPGGEPQEGGIQIVVQSPAEVEASEKSEEFTENLYAEIDLKIQTAKAIETRVGGCQEEDGEVQPPNGGAGILLEMKDFESKLEEIIKSTEEVFVMTSKDHYATVLGEKMYKEEEEEGVKKDVEEEVYSTGKEDNEEIEEISNKQKKEEKVEVNCVAEKKEPKIPTENTKIAQIPKAPTPPFETTKLAGKPPRAPQSLKPFKSALRQDLPKFPERFNETTEQTFYEEEYSYEPELKKSSTKVVMRTRSLVNLDESSGGGLGGGGCGSKRGKKITTGPDGTFRFGGRKATSEMNLTDESGPSSNDGSPKALRYLSGEDLKRRKEEIFKEKPRAKSNCNKYNEEINSNCDETTKQRALKNLRRYLRENNIGLREILVNNNVVIIEPIRSGNGEGYDISEYNHKNAGEVEGKCRLAGGKTKESGQVSNTLPRVSKPFQTTVQRHFFYHPLVKPNPLLKDDELPDPDKVRKNRQMFQKNNVKYARKEDRFIMLPIAAKWLFGSSEKKKPRTTPEVRVVDTGFKVGRKEGGGSSSGGSERGSSGKKTWTDTGSLSSGVSSDMSCFETDDTGSNKEGGFTTDDEYEDYEDEEGRGEGARRRGEDPRHPVSPEVLKKIRACGTSVTYYGGRVISHTNGPIRSPMTMTIMDEIRQTGTVEEEGRRRGDYMGVKFRLIKSNSCGSRLELAGTEDGINEGGGGGIGGEMSKIRFQEDVYGPSKSLSQELAECRRGGDRMTMEPPIEDEREYEEGHTPIKPFNTVKKAFEAKFGCGRNSGGGMEKKSSVQSWRALIESRKQSRVMESSNRPCCRDMEFEEFQVAEG